MPVLSDTTRTDLSRFRYYFPLACWVIEHVWMLLPIFGIVAMALGSLSIHYGLSVMCVWMGLLCFWVDRKHLNYLLFTPLQPLAVICIMSLGAGISMLTIESDEKYKLGFLAMQLTGLLGFPFMIIGYYIMSSRLPGFVFPATSSGPGRRLIKPLLIVGWFCLLHELAKVSAGIISGSADRGLAGDFQLDTPFGWWSAFAIFLRIQTLGFILVPLIWREGPMWSRAGVAMVAFTILFLHFVGASRGAVFFPIFIMTVGCYLFLNIKKIKYEPLIALGVLGLLPLLTIMSYYRSTQAFRETDIRNVFKKLGTIKEGLEQKKEREEESGEKLSEAGRAFVGVADYLIYEMTPHDVPHEGFGRLDGIVWELVPYMFTQGQRPLMQDGNLITSYYRGYSVSRTSIGITYPAELYRRWGWIAVPIGLFLYGLFYGGVFRLVYGVYFWRNALWGFIMCGVLFHFFVAWYFHTILNLVWFWTYDTPKNLALLGLLYLGMRFFLGIRPPPGALNLINAQRRLALGRPRQTAHVAQGVTSTADTQAGAC
jgi:hypothetical protein